MWRYERVFCFVLFLVIQTSFCLGKDYVEILRKFTASGLVSERVKRSLHNTAQLSGINSGGCPFHSANRNREKRELSNQQAAHNILNIMSGLTHTYGSEEAHRRVKRVVNSDVFCDNDWVDCSYSAKKYRNFDGTCNNLVKPTLGSAMSAHLRFLNAEYADGVGMPRMHAKSGNCLPSPRTVSRTIHLQASNSDMNLSTKFSHMQMVYGQFLDHDIALTPHGSKDVPCCDKGVRHTAALPRCSSKSSRSSIRAMFSQMNKPMGDDRLPSEVCFPIDVETGDSEYNNCIDFKRSIGVPTNHCGTGSPVRREQINEVTSYIDGSGIYGSSRVINLQLRSHVDGKMKLTAAGTLPHDPHPDTGCILDSDNQQCFQAGDVRVNMQPGLVSLHNLFILEHNRICDILRSSLTTTFRTIHTRREIDQYLFQEARRVVVAMLQHITYNEYLPSMLDTKTLQKYKLRPLTDYPTNKRMRYNHRSKPGIRNEFATVSFRVGHTFIPSGIQAMTSDYRNDGPMTKFQDVFLNPKLVYQYGSDSIIRGIIKSPAKVPSCEVTDNLEKMLVRLNTSFGGFDLAAFNIQRGRDHGIPAYNKLRQFCGLPVARGFNNLDMEPSVIRKLRNIYEHVDDIDAWTGAVSERRNSNGMLGPLNACIFGKQFMYLKKADRFWYEFQNRDAKFTDRQLTELYKSSLAGLICNHIRVTNIQKNVIQLPGTDNPIFNCREITQPNLTGWLSM